MYTTASVGKTNSHKTGIYFTEHSNNNCTYYAITPKLHCQLLAETIIVQDITYIKIQHNKKINMYIFWNRWQKIHGICKYLKYNYSENVVQTCPKIYKYCIPCEIMDSFQWNCTSTFRWESSIHYKFTKDISFIRNNQSNWLKW
jgi:hypothetical protein